MFLLCRDSAYQTSFTLWNQLPSRYLEIILKQSAFYVSGSTTHAIGFGSPLVTTIQSSHQLEEGVCVWVEGGVSHELS